MSTDDDARASLFAAAPSRARPPAAAASRGEAAPARPPPSVAPDAARKNATDELLPPTVDDLNRASLLSGGGGGSRSAPVKPPEPVPAAAPPAPPADDDDGAVEFDFENLNLSAGAGGERGEEALDFGAIDADLTNFAQDGVIREALSRGVDLRLYARTVDAELRSMEMLSIGDYVAEADAIAGLFEQIVGCESVLGDMQRMLGAFQANLGGISAEIRQLQEQSLSLSARMANRKSLNNVLRSFLAKVSVPELLIEAITEGTMDDAWFATHLRQLSEKLAFTYGHQQQQGGNGPARSAPSTTPAGSTGPSDDAAADALHSLSVSPFATPAGKDALPNLEKLRAKAVARLREHLVRAIGELARPKQNMQKQQEYALMKSSPGMAFLTDHAPDVAREVRAVYIDTVGRAVADIFKRYSEELARALLPAPASGETVVDVRGGSGASAAAATGAAAVDAFSVAGRLGVLDAAGDPAPPGHVVTAEHSRLPYEALYRSLQRHLVDVAAAEDSFDRRFFGDRFGSDVFTNVIGRPIAVLFAGLEAHIAGSPDAPGIMILVALVAAHRRLLVDRAGGTSAPGAHCLDSYFDRAVLLLWPRFKAILDANIGALRSAAKTEAGGSGSTSALARRLGSPVDGLGAHAVTKRFAEFHASLLVLHRRLADAHASDDMLPRHIVTLRREYDALLARMATEGAPAASKTARVVFLINNLSTVLNTAVERGVHQDDAAPVELALKAQLDAYVDTELDANFRGLIAWVRKIEAATVAAATAAGLAPKAASDGAAPPRLPEGVPVTASAAEAEAALREFSLAWRAGVKALGDNVQRYFPDSRTTGFSVLKRVMGGFVDVYDRATAILARAFPPNAPFLRELVVPTTTLYYEIKRASRAFE